MPSKIGRRVDNRKVDVARALVLASRGLSFAEIADTMHCSPQAVHQAIQRFKPLLLTEEQVTVIDQAQGRMIKGAMFEMIRTAVDPAKLKKLSARDAIWNYGVLFDKSRVLEGKSTSNVFHGVMVKLQRDALQLGLQVPPDGVETTDKAHTKKDEDTAKS
jgi:predicted DNA-binding protein YlxM (UPF0122 family)